MYLNTKLMIKTHIIKKNILLTLFCFKIFVVINLTILCVFSNKKYFLMLYQYILLHLVSDQGDNVKMNQES